MNSLATINGEPVIMPGLADLAAEINRHHAAVHESLTAGLAHARAAGEALLTAKALVQHGEWAGWLTANCAVTERQAQRYLLIAKKWDEIEKRHAVSDLSLRGALKLLAAPEADPPATDKDAHEFEALQAERQRLQEDFDRARKATFDDPGMGVETWHSIAKRAEELGLRAGAFAVRCESAARDLRVGLLKDSVTTEQFEQFKNVASALREVQDRELFREAGYDSFSEYCRGRWGIEAPSDLETCKPESTFIPREGQKLIGKRGGRMLWIIPSSLESHCFVARVDEADAGCAIVEGSKKPIHRDFVEFALGRLDGTYASYSWSAYPSAPWPENFWVPA